MIPFRPIDPDMDLVFLQGVFLIKPFQQGSEIEVVILPTKE